MPIPSVIYLYPRNTQVLEINGLQDITTGLFLDAATVTATLYNNNGVADPVLNGIVLAYVNGTNGNYQGTVPDTFQPCLGAGYLLQIIANQGGVQSVWSIPAKVLLRAGL